MNELIPTHEAGVPAVTREQMKAVDRLMVERYRIQLVQMMENAGRALAVVARERFLEGDARDKRVIVMAGTGGNGGGGLVCARRLAAWGARVELILTAQPKRYRGTVRQQLEIVQKMGVPAGTETLPEEHGEAHGSYDLLIDALVGYSLEGAPRGIVATLVHWANTSKLKLLSLDVPTGVDATEGTAYDPAVRADATLTVALPKTGLLSSYAQEHIGELYLADIGVPPRLYFDEELGFPEAEVEQIRAAFAAGDIVRLFG